MASKKRRRTIKIADGKSVTVSKSRSGGVLSYQMLELPRDGHVTAVNEGVGLSFHSTYPIRDGKKHRHLGRLSAREIAEMQLFRLAHVADMPAEERVWIPRPALFEEQKGSTLPEGNVIAEIEGEDLLNPAYWENLSFADFGTRPESFAVRKVSGLLSWIMKVPGAQTYELSTKDLVAAGGDAMERTGILEFFRDSFSDQNRQQLDRIVRAWKDEQSVRD